MGKGGIKQIWRDHNKSTRKWGGWLSHSVLSETTNQEYLRELTKTILVNYLRLSENVLDICLIFLYQYYNTTLENNTLGLSCAKLVYAWVGNFWFGIKKLIKTTSVTGLKFTRLVQTEEITNKALERWTNVAWRNVAWTNFHWTNVHWTTVKNGSTNLKFPLQYFPWVGVGGWGGNGG